MTDTAALAAIHRHVDAAGAKLLLVGDHRQLAAVGAGGGMDLLAAGRRAATSWSRPAASPTSGSGRRRCGCAPATRPCCASYHQQGRLLDAGTVEQAEAVRRPRRGWPTPSPGSRSLLLVDTNEQAARLSAQLRAELVRLGQVEENGVPLGLQGTVAGVGDLVQARLNGWDLAGLRGQPPRPDQPRDLPRHRRPRRRRPRRRRRSPADGQRRGSGWCSRRLRGRAPRARLRLHRARRAGPDRRHLPRRRSPRGRRLGRASTSRCPAAATPTPPTSPPSATVDDPAQGGERAPAAPRPGRRARRRARQPTTRSPPAPRWRSPPNPPTRPEACGPPAELLADAAQLAATERTAGWLDQLTVDRRTSPRRSAPGSPPRTAPPR